MKKLVYLLPVLVFFTQTAVADDRKSAEELLRKEISSVLELISKKNMDPLEKREKVMKIVSAVFDFPLIAKLTLGKKIWPTFSREQKKEFIKLFSRQLEDTYYRKIQFFSEDEVIYEKAKQLKKKVHILTRVVQKDKSIDVLYKMYKSRGNWKVYDAEIQGVSIIASYRAQYREFLKRETVDTFIKKLQSRNNGLTS